MVSIVLAMLLAGGPMAPPDDAAQEQAIRLAKTALSKELGVSEDKVKIESALAATWSDASLGCPRKGMQYAQMITQGYRMTLRVDEKPYGVHVAGRQVVVCRDDSGAAEPLAESSVGAVARVYGLARRDLASRLKVVERQIKVNFVRPTVWPDRSLGCPEPDKNYPQVLTRGFLVELKFDGKTYHYHTDTTRVLLCEKPPSR